MKFHRLISNSSARVAGAWLVALAAWTGSPGAVHAATDATFVNWENPVVHPVDLSPDGETLAVANLPDGRLELFDVTSGVPALKASIPVGVDPVTARFRTNDEVWVINHISDSVSVVDLNLGRVIATIQTLDEPADVVFAAGRAFVSCSQANAIMVFLPETRSLFATIPIKGEDPRALAVAPGGTRVYAAIFESGNQTTVLPGGSLREVRDDVGVNDPDGPYGGTNPPPNDGAAFAPPQNPAVVATPVPSSIIVRKNGAGRWMDDNSGDWTRWITGDKANAHSFRPSGWDMPDRDLAVINTSTLGVTYATGLMNICMSLAVNPSSGQIAVIGTDSTNEIRFEPNLTGTFTRVKFARASSAGPTTLAVVDLNTHLDYSVPTIDQSERDKSIGDPRGIVFNSPGTRAYVTGMGSNNMTIVDANGARVGLEPTIELGEGPTGIVIDETRNLLYVLNRFESSLSVVDLATESEIARVAIYDPTPEAIKTGRKHQYDTHKNSGLGQIACASCHVDSRIDRLGWDLGDPAGEIKSSADRNRGNGIGGLREPDLFDDYHPMKGVMTTQTLQDIIGHEPLHWRGDRDGIEEFNGAFMGLQGDDEMLTDEEMQEYEDFLATITFPPNPFRTFRNALPTDLPLAGHYATGRFASLPGGLSLGAPFPNGNAQRALGEYRGDGGRTLDGGASCALCHTLPTGMGGDNTLVGVNTFATLAPGPNGERHLSIIGQDGSTNRNLKTPQTRNMYDKVGFENSGETSAGFGFAHDGRVPTIATFVGAGVFEMESDQEIADMVAFMLAFAGSDLPEPDGSSILQGPPGPPSKDTHAAVGKQVTITSQVSQPLFGQADAITTMLELADDPAGRVDLVVSGVENNVNRGWFYDPASGGFLADRNGEMISVAGLRALAGPGAELTYTAVPRGSGRRIGIDRDEDGSGNLDERLAGSDPADPNSIPQAEAERWSFYN